MRRAQNLHSLAVVLLGKNVEEALNRTAGVAAAVLEVFDLLDADAKPAGELRLRELRGRAQLTNAFSSPLHKNRGLRFLLVFALLAERCGIFKLLC